MTLKQFFQLAGGLVVGLIFYSSPLLGIIKWPLAIISGILGALLAFVPLEERPLEKWIFAFFRAIYAPTEFFWKRTTTRPKFFQDEPANPPTEQNEAAKEYLATTAPKGSPFLKLDEAEQGFLSKLSGLFSGIGQAAPAAQTPTAQAASEQPAATEEKKEGLKIPESVPVKITPTQAPHLVIEEKPKAPGQVTPNITTQQVAPIVAGDEMISTKQAIFSVDAAPPNPPTTPNVIVGQVVDQNRKIVEAAIIEVRDSSGRPVRALRSNRAGHFITVTPIDNGKYDIITEKDGYEFSPVSFEANGNLIPPILVQGRSVIAQAPVVSSTQTTNNPSLNQTN